MLFERQESDLSGKDADAKKCSDPVNAGRVLAQGASGENSGNNRGDGAYLVG